MSEFVPVARTDEIVEGQGTAFNVQGRMVAVFRQGDQFFAIDDFCPHMGASLAGGHVERGVVSCPWHAWRFSIEDGTWCDNPRLKVESFEVRVENDQILVRVPPKNNESTAEGNA
jgi:nitrite reductase (NADH) small subunit